MPPPTTHVWINFISSLIYKNHPLPLMELYKPQAYNQDFGVKETLLDYKFVRNRP